MKPLRKITFDGYIFLQMKNYQRKHGSNEGFKFMKVKNRNPKYVGDELWVQILYKHLKFYNKN